MPVVCFDIIIATDQRIQIISCPAVRCVYTDVTYLIDSFAMIIAITLDGAVPSLT